MRGFSKPGACGPWRARVVSPYFVLLSLRSFSFF